MKRTLLTIFLLGTVFNLSVVGLPAQVSANHAPNTQAETYDWRPNLSRGRADTTPRTCIPQNSATDTNCASRIRVNTGRGVYSSSVQHDQGDWDDTCQRPGEGGTYTAQEEEEYCGSFFNFKYLREDAGEVLRYRAYIHIDPGGAFSAKERCEFHMQMRKDGTGAYSQGTITNETGGGGQCQNMFDDLSDKTPTVTNAAPPEEEPDDDGDGIPNNEDDCPDVAGPASSRGCPPPTTDDSDGDGVLNDADACPTQPGPASNNGCPVGTPTADDDGDGVPNSSDNCPSDPNPDQANTYGDARGDACESKEPPPPEKSQAGVAQKDAAGDCPKGYITLSVSLGRDRFDDDNDEASVPPGEREIVDCVGKGDETFYFNPIIVYMRFVIRVLSGIVGITVAIMIIVSGIMYVTSAGNPERVARAKKYLTNSVLAFFLYIFAVALINFVVPGGVL